MKERLCPICTLLMKRKPQNSQTFYYDCDQVNHHYSECDSYLGPKMTWLLDKIKQEVIC